MVEVPPARPRPSLHLAPCSIRAQLAVEEERRQQWADENIRRRHDYIPAIFNLLTGLAEGGQLQPLVEQAKAAHKAKLEERQQRKGGS